MKPDLQDEYAIEKFKWFLTDNSAEQQRFPGKVCSIYSSSNLSCIQLKEEARTIDGAYVGVSAKECCILYTYKVIMYICNKVIS